MNPQIPCLQCGQPFLRRGRRRFCSQACRQRAFRARHASTVPIDLPPRRTPNLTVYECECGNRMLGENRCDLCNRFARSLGFGLPCPHCGELLVLGELLNELGFPPPSTTNKEVRLLP